MFFVLNSVTCCIINNSVAVLAFFHSFFGESKWDSLSASQKVRCSSVLCKSAKKVTKQIDKSNFNGVINIACSLAYSVRITCKVELLHVWKIDRRIMKTFAWVTTKDDFAWGNSLEEAFRMLLSIRYLGSLIACTSPQGAIDKLIFCMNEWNISCKSLA